MSSDDDKNPTIGPLRPHQLGWLRRPELDSDYVDVWEMPDGKCVAMPKGKHPMLWKGAPPTK